jgi:DNA-binding NarL/FixJ family response regulator
MKIMIVEDHKVMREKIATLLARPGVEVLECSTGEEAMESARRFQPGCIVIDIGLPGANGFEVAKAIRPDVPAARMIVISAQPEIDLEEVRAVGAERFLSKSRLATLPEMVYGVEAAAAGRSNG